MKCKWFVRVAALGAAVPAVALAAPAPLPPAQAAALLNSFGLRVAACNPDSPIPMSEIRTAPPQPTFGIGFQSRSIPVYPVKGRFTGTCKGGSAASGRIDTFTIDGAFQTGLYKDAFGEWKHTAVLRPQCAQERTSYQVTGGPLTPASDKEICDYTAPR